MVIQLIYICILLAPFYTRAMDKNQSHNRFKSTSNRFAAPNRFTSKTPQAIQPHSSINALDKKDATSKDALEKFTKETSERNQNNTELALSIFDRIAKGETISPEDQANILKKLEDARLAQKEAFEKAKASIENQQP